MPPCMKGVGVVFGLLDALVGSFPWASGLLFYFQGAQGARWVFSTHTSRGAGMVVVAFTCEFKNRAEAIKKCHLVVKPLVPVTALN